MPRPPTHVNCISNLFTLESFPFALSAVLNTPVVLQIYSDAHYSIMAMMASGTSGNPNVFDEDHAVLDDDFLNDGKVPAASAQAEALTTSRGRAG